MTQRRKHGDEALRQQALESLRDPHFLFRVAKRIEAEGLVGERRNGLIIFLATLTANFRAPVSVMVKAPSSSGKSTLAAAPLRMLPTGVVMPRSSLSAKAPAHGKEPLAGKVLYLAELRGGKDGQYLLRSLQSEAVVTHEFATVCGPARTTQLAQRSGSPVVVTTTTQDHIFEDDATRFLLISPDQSEKQTRAVLLAELKPGATRDAHELAVIHKSVEILREHTPQIQFPYWFETVVEHVPRTLRSRRDWRRFLSLCSVIALIRLHRTNDAKPAAIGVHFSDYAVAYRLLNRVFSRTASKANSSTDELVAAVENLYRKTGAGVSFRQVKEFLCWESKTVYKHATLAEQRGYLQYESGTRRNNEKRLLPKACEHRGDFLLSPRALLKQHPELKGCKFVDPITGKTKVIGRVSRAILRNSRNAESD